MPEPIDLYWSFRSPYSYLALKPIRDMAARRDVEFNLKIVHPLAIRDPHFFDSRGSAWLGYVMRDVFRLAQMTDQLISRPNPDPIIQNFETGKIADDQPHIYRLAYLGILAADAGIGLDFVSTFSRLIWSGQAWNEGTILIDAMDKAGIDLGALEAKIEGHEQPLDKKLDENDMALRKAGHWGVPTTVLRGEPFFGMDRLNVLEWRLDQLGVD